MKKYIFRGKGRVRLSVYIGRLPEHTREGATREWQIIDELEQPIEELDRRLCGGLCRSR